MFYPYNSVNASVIASNYVYSSDNPCPAKLETAQIACVQKASASRRFRAMMPVYFQIIGRMLLAAVMQLHFFGATNDAARFDIRPAIASRNIRIASERDFIP